MAPYDSPDTQHKAEFADLRQKSRRVQAGSPRIAEFSLVPASVGLQVGIIEGFSYQMTIAVIALSLLLSPAWIAATKKLVRADANV